MVCLIPQLLFYQEVSLKAFHFSATQAPGRGAGLTSEAVWGLRVLPALRGGGPQEAPPPRRSQLRVGGTAVSPSPSQ